MQYKINATIIKHWYQYGCERKLLYSADKIENKTQIETLPDTYDDGTKHPGTIFEEDVTKKLQQSNHVYVPKGNKKELTSIQWNHFVRCIDGHDTAYAWQPVVEGESIANILQLPSNVTLSKGFIDFVRREDKGDHILLTIIDAKYSPISTHFHKIQVAYYARILELELAVLNEKKPFPKPVRISSTGEIWIPSEEDGVLWTEEAFMLQPFQNELDYFFQHEIRRLSQIQVRPEDQSHFHLYYKCEQCKYRPHCLKSVQKENPEDMDLSAIFGLTQYTKRKLKERGFHTIGDVSALELDHFEEETLWKLQGAGETFIRRAKALMDNKPIFKEGTRTISMPATVDCPIFITVDRSANHGFLVSIGLRITHLDGTIKEELYTISTKQDERAILEKCLNTIQTLLQDLHDWNSDKANKDQPKTCQIFTYEASEMRNLKASISTYIEDPAFTDKYKLLLRILTPEGLIPDPLYNNLNQSLMTTVRSTFEQLYAIPSTITYDLARLSQALENTTSFSGAYIPEEDFAHPFSSQLSMDQVENIIHDRADTTAIKEDVQARLEATHRLIEWLMAQNAAASETFLCLDNAPFIIQEDKHTMNVGGLDGLHTQTVLGTNESIKSHFHNLSKPLAQRIKSGSTWGYLRLLSIPEPDDAAFLLRFETNQTDTCNLNVGAYNTFLHAESENILLNKRQQGLHKCNIVEIKGTGDCIYLTVQIKKSVHNRLKSALIVDSVWSIDAGINPINDYRIQDFLASLQ